MYNLFNYNPDLNIDQQNPFPCDLERPVDVFFDMLKIVQIQHWEQSQIGRAYRDDLNASLRLLEDLKGPAKSGLTERVKKGIESCLRKFARHRALYQFLDGAANGWTLTRETPGLESAVRRVIADEHDRLSSLLLVPFIEGARERQQTIWQEEQAQFRIKEESALQHAKQAEDRNDQLVKVLNEQAGKIPEQVRLSLEKADESLELAMTQARQFQDGLPLFIDPVAKLVESSSQLVASIDQHLQEHKPSSVEEGVVRAEKRKRNSQLRWFLIAILVPLILFEVAEWLPHFLK